MNANIKPQLFISVLLMLFMTFSFGQNRTQKSIGDVVYQEYTQNGIDPALERYHSLKAENTGDYRITEWELNRIAYELMEDGDMEAAEKLFTLNMNEYPQAANPRDSYADYLLAKGDTVQARKYLKESVTLAEKNQKEEEKRILKASKAKLAKLDNKHKQFDFLTGNWEITGTGFNEDMPTGSQKGLDEHMYDEELNMFTVNHKNEQGEVTAKRIFVYNPHTDAYDMALIRAGAPLGIDVSRIRLKNTGNDTYEFIEEFEEEGVTRKMKHELKRKGKNGMDWIIFEEGQSTNDWKKVYAMDMKRNN